MAVYLVRFNVSHRRSLISCIDIGILELVALIVEAYFFLKVSHKILNGPAVFCRESLILIKSHYSSAM